MQIIKVHMVNLDQREKGQAMAEFCVAAPVLVLLLWSILYVADMFIVKHRTLVAARYGTWLLSRYDNIPQNNISVEMVRGLISENFFRNDSNNLSVHPQYERGENEDGGFLEHLDRGVESGEWLDSIIDFFADNLISTDDPNLYSLNVAYNYPRYFGAVDLRNDGNEYFEIQSDHFVIGNSWDGQRVETHHLVEILEEPLSDVLEEMDNIDEKIEAIRFRR
jgi:hypothetical protein